MLMNDTEDARHWSTVLQTEFTKKPRELTESSSRNRQDSGSRFSRGSQVWSETPQSIDGFSEGLTFSIGTRVCNQCLGSPSVVAYGTVLCPSVIAER